MNASAATDSESLEALLSRRQRVLRQLPQQAAWQNAEAGLAHWQAKMHPRQGAACRALCNGRPEAAGLAGWAEHTRLAAAGRKACRGSRERGWCHGDGKHFSHRQTWRGLLTPQPWVSTLRLLADGRTAPARSACKERSAHHRGAALSWRIFLPVTSCAPRSLCSTQQQACPA